MDTSYAVRKIDIGINKAINIDWVQDISITQDFEKFGQKAWLLSKEEISIDFGVVKNSLGLYGQRTISYKGYKINEPISESVFKGPAKVEKMILVLLKTAFGNRTGIFPFPSLRAKSTVR